MNKEQTDMLVGALQDLGFGTKHFSIDGSPTYPGIGEKIGMELARVADENSAIATAIDRVADALYEVAEAMKSQH